MPPSLDVLPPDSASLAYTDPLTGLANRARFADHMHKAMLLARQGGLVFAVLMLDLDNFKSVTTATGTSSAMSHCNRRAPHMRSASRRSTISTCPCRTDRSALLGADRAG